ncbi:hypothetical protein SAMN04488027_104139 [Psychroflexus sediminis]|uniref:Uncharacterized protein n=1 Tax=Psychroflexus sediminis TaxID=470826 RepID=A0A1G7VTL3_9FLAO|nr:hypothetical protein SAMN04488027_104139 [Psychroflexus sediminis]
MIELNPKLPGFSILSAALQVEKHTKETILLFYLLFSSDKKI